MVENIINKRKEKYFQKIKFLLKGFKEEYINSILSFHPEIPDDFFDFDENNEND